MAHIHSFGSRGRLPCACGVTPEDYAATGGAETMATCPCCEKGMVRPAERARLMRLLADAAAAALPIALESGDLDEVDE